jgi:hypothetical protein
LLPILFGQQDRRIVIPFSYVLTREQRMDKEQAVLIAGNGDK